MFGQILQNIVSIFTVDSSPMPIEMTLAGSSDDAAETCRGFCFTEQTFAIISCVAAAFAVIAAQLADKSSARWRFIRRMLVMLMFISLIIMASVVTSWKTRGVDKCGFDTDTTSNGVASLNPKGLASSANHMVSNHDLREMTARFVGMPVQPVQSCMPDISTRHSHVAIDDFDLNANEVAPLDESDEYDPTITTYNNATLGSCSIEASITFEEYGASFYIMWIAFGFGFVAFMSELIGMYQGKDYTAISGSELMMNAKF